MSRSGSAAASSCSTTSRAISSARRASSAPRRAPSSASTWAASTRWAASTSTGARPRRTASGARSRPCGAPGGRSRILPTPTSRTSTSRPWTASPWSSTSTRNGRCRSSRRSNSEYGYLPAAALKRYSQVSGAPYALLYGTASYYRHLHLEDAGSTIGVCACPSCALAGAGQIARALADELGTEVGRKPETGHLTLEYLPVHIAGAASPLIALDGAPQEVTRAGVAAWVRALASGAAAGAASSKPAGARRRAAGPDAPTPGRSRRPQA